MSDIRTPLSKRIRPDCEAAPWVIEEIIQLETTVTNMTKDAAIKSLPEAVADALRKFCPEDAKVIWRGDFRWRDDGGVLSNHSDGMSVAKLADDFQYEVIVDMKDAAIVRRIQSQEKGKS